MSILAATAEDCTNGDSISAWAEERGWNMRADGLHPPGSYTAGSLLNKCLHFNAVKTVINESKSFLLNRRKYYLYLEGFSLTEVSFTSPTQLVR